MTKRELIQELADSAGCPQATAAKVLEALVTTAYSEAANGFIIPGLCKIEVVDRKPRRCRDPRTGVSLMIGARKGVRIRALKKAKDTIAPVDPDSVVVIVDEPPAPAAASADVVVVPEEAEVAPQSPPPPVASAATLAGEGDQVFIYFRCLSCGQEIEAPPDMAGSASECPVCSASIRVPEVAAPAELEPETGDEESAEMGRLLHDAMKKRTVRIELPDEDIQELDSPAPPAEKKKKVVFKRRGVV